MTLPAMKPVAEEFYAAIAPLAWDDANHGYAALHVGAAMVAGAEEIAELVEDTDDGHPGWSMIVDLERAPDKWLDWLGQCKGARLVSTLPPETKRLQIANASGMERGGIDALVTRIQAFLTGEKRVFVRERYNPDAGLEDAWHLHVMTYNDDTPEPSKVEAFLALEDTVPAGIIVHYEAVEGQDWLQLRTNHSTWADVLATYPTWGDVIADTP